MNIMYRLCPLFPILAIISCAICKTNLRLCRKYYLAFGSVLGGIGYTFVPKNVIDYTRYQEQIEYISDSGSLLNIIVNDSEKLFLRDIVFYVIGQFENEQALAVVTATIIYTIVAYVLFDTINNVLKNKINYFYVFTILVFSVSVVPVFTIISLTRNVLCFALMFLGLYLEIIYKKKLIPYSIYISMVFFHHSAIIFIVARLIMPFIKISPVYLITPIFAVIVTYAVVDMIDYFFSSDNIAYITVHRILGYIENNNYGWGVDMFKYDSEIINFCYQVIFLCVNLFFQLILKTKICEYEKLLRLLFVFGLISISCIFINPGVFSRFVSVQSLFSVIIFSKLFICCSNKTVCLCMASVVCFAFVKILFDIVCYYSFVDMSVFFENYAFGALKFL